MPFTRSLWPVPPPLAECIRGSLDRLLALMAAPPAECHRVEQHPEYLDQLASALVTVGQAFESAQLKDELTHPGSWEQGSYPDRWGRLFLLKGLNPSLRKEGLEVFLSQQPAGDPHFFYAMRACLETFRDIVLGQISLTASSSGRNNTDELHDREWELLQAAEALQAFGVRSRRSLAQLARRADPGIKSTTFKPHLAKLVKRELMTAIKGRGSYITSAGRERLNER